MSDQPDRSGQPANPEEEGSHASVGQDASRPGSGRTEGETSVDEAMGEGTAATEEG